MAHITALSLVLNLLLIIHAIGNYWERTRAQRIKLAADAKRKQATRQHVNACLHVSASAMRRYNTSNN
jgi:hypothetical protein